MGAEPAPTTNFPLTKGVSCNRICTFFKIWHHDVIESRSGLKIRWSKDREGLSPSGATIFNLVLLYFAAMRTVVTKT